MNRTPTTLSDGRELFFFDDRPGSDRRVDDPRGLLPSEPAPELRHDPLVDDWVVLAAHRQTRTHLPPTDECPLCPSTAERATEVPSRAYDVVVFENRFPSLARSTPTPAPTVGGAELFPRRPANGRCEVVCFTDEHDTSFAQLSPARVSTVMQAWADRTRELSDLPGIRLVAPFENRGQEIGVTLSHPHGQVYAYPFLPERTERMLRAARLYLDLLGRLDRLFDAPLPYIAAWHQAPVGEGRDLLPLHLQLTSIRRAPGKLKYLAGSEAAYGAFVNDVSPERTAALLREKGE